MRKNNLCRFLPALYAGILLLAVTGCATSDKREYFGSGPIALVSLVANDDINWKDEAPLNPNLTTRSARRTMQEDPDKNMVTSSNEFIDEIETLIRNTLESAAFITFAERDRVLRSQSYNEAGINSLQEKDQMAKPQGFRYINFRDNKFLSALYTETGIGNALYINLNLTKFMYSGFGKNGNYRANVSMSVMLKNEQGKTLYNKTYQLSSRDNADVSGGIYSQSDLRHLLISAIEDACYYFLDDLAY